MSKCCDKCIEWKMGLSYFNKYEKESYYVCRDKTCPCHQAPDKEICTHYIKEDDLYVSHGKENHSAKECKNCPVCIEVEKEFKLFKDNCKHTNVEMAFFEGDRAGTRCKDCGKESTPPDKENNWEEIRKLVYLRPQNLQDAEEIWQKVSAEISNLLSTQREEILEKVREKRWPKGMEEGLCGSEGEEHNQDIADLEAYLEKKK